MKKKQKISIQSISINTEKLQNDKEFVIYKSDHYLASKTENEICNIRVYFLKDTRRKAYFYTVHFLQQLP